ncbi:MAG: hypothetical protein ACI4WX_11830 [Aristaeellaceae bacterium]
MSRIRYELEYTYVPNADKINDMIRDFDRLVKQLPDECWLR